MRTIDYRNPKNLTRSGEDRLAAQLRNRDGLFEAKTTFAFASGCVLSFLGPVLIAELIAIFIHKRDPYADTHFLLCFVGTSVILLPLLYRTERRTRGQFFIEQVRGMDFESTPLSYSEWRGRVDLATLAGWIEIFLFGPRMVLEARSNFGMWLIVRNADRTRAAEILRTLLNSDHAVSTLTLQTPGERTARFALVLKYLVVQDWIGLSKDGQRAWALTEARRRAA